MTVRFVRWVVLVALAWIVVHSIPSVARYFKMREM